MNRRIAAALCAAICAVTLTTGPGVFGQAIREESGRSAASTQSSALPSAMPSVIPVKKIALFSSGLAYYEHAGTLNGPARIRLPFTTAAINDALKSLVINDPASANPQVTYQSEQTLPQTLRSLGIDLSDEPDLARMLGRLRGAEIEVSGPVPASGRIVGVEYRSTVTPLGETVEPWLSLYTAQGLKLFSLKETGAVVFKDPQLNADLGRALDLIAASRNSRSRELLVSLPGTGGGSRQVAMSYVIPAPVWKVSYRLDWFAKQTAQAGTTAADEARDSGAALFQGWAIVDNDSDSDWAGVELSLVAGRPASFIQNLYPPYYQYRPTLPLAIAGTATAAAHDSGYEMTAPRPENQAARAPAMKFAAEAEGAYTADAHAKMEPPAPNVAGGAIRTAQGAAAGDQFEFTVQQPVSLDRRMSAMLPLVEADIQARKVLIFSGAGAAGRNLHPRLGAELTNNTGMKLPAGPVTVYDGGAYAGDALLEFWNNGEQRLVSYGEDLSVTGAIADSGSRSVIAVAVAGGVMTISRGQEYLKSYTFKNSSGQMKRLIVEHPKTPGASLESPEADEQTPAAYRFAMTLPPDREIMLLVRETRPVAERISLLSLRPESFASYAASQEIPARVREALQKAAGLKRDAEAADAEAAELESRREYLAGEQDRIRKNIEAAGGQTQQGQEYLKRLAALDGDIDRITPRLEELRAGAKAARKAYEDYLGGLNL